MVAPESESPIGIGERDVVNLIDCANGRLIGKLDDAFGGVRGESPKS